VIGSAEDGTAIRAPIWRAKSGRKAVRKFPLCRTNSDRNPAHTLPLDHDPHTFRSRPRPRPFTMHYFSQAFDYSHPWSHVVIGMWHKYPNPHCTHVLTVDVLDRSIDPQTGVVRTERILGCKQKAPSWIAKLFGSEDAYVREVSFIDPRTQTMDVTSVNLSMSQVATCYERILYRPSPLNPREHTAFSQTAEIQARLHLWRTVSDSLEKWLAERFEQNAQKGKLGLSDVLRSLWESKEPQPMHFQ